MSTARVALAWAELQPKPVTFEAMGARWGNSTTYSANITRKAREFFLRFPGCYPDEN